MPIPVERFLRCCREPLGLRLAAGAGGLARGITERSVQKAGLGITGEVESTHPGKIQILGETEVTYFRNQPEDRQARIAGLFFSRPMACAIVGGGQSVPLQMIGNADRQGVPLFVSDLSTSDLIAAVLKDLDRLFAEATTIHGVLLEILGMGVVLQGRSGVGKSECALDLILRGHRFVTDDVIHLEKRGPGTVLGAGGDVTRHHMEIRGLGIINIRDLFGPAAIVDMKKVELVLQIEEWDAGKDYDRLGREERTTELLGVPIPTYLIPVSPGRNLATIVEVAVRNRQLMQRGIHSARDLLERHSRLVGRGKPE